MSRVIVITGAGGGLGKEFVRQYIEREFFVIGVDLNTDCLAEFNRDNFVAINCDLTNKKHLTNLISDIVNKYGTPYMWINNAGIVNIASFFDETEKKYEQVMKINVDVPVRIMKKIIPIMERNGGGKIINVSSVAGLVSAPILSSYCASKFALVGITESVQQELMLKKSPVDLVLVCPGFIKTELIKLGHEDGFPEQLTPFLSTTKKAVENIIKGIDLNKKFIDPTLNGKVMSFASKYGPKKLKEFAAKLAVPKTLIQKIKS